ncbi:MAG: KTSC domain-containing protein [Clostridiales bacterium]|nr:KTSC domain-containing protein [Clostridiales bacterium]
MDSSRIASIGWSKNVMEVEFHNGAVYQYEDVTLEEYWAFRNAPSLGRALSEFDQRHPYFRVE